MRSRTTKDYNEIVARLRSIFPDGWEITAAQREPRMTSTADAKQQFQPDLLLELRAPDGSRSNLVVETKSKAIEPRDIPNIVKQLTTYSAGLAALTVPRGAVGAGMIVAAAFVSPRARELLSKLGVGYLDQTGNLRLVLERPAVFVERAGSDRNPFREERPLKSLKGPATARVVRALCDFRPPYGIRDLADRAGASLGSVARVVGFLEREAIVKRDEDRGVAEVEWPALIRRWSQDYTSSAPARTITYREPRGLEQFFDKLRAADLQYAVTGSFAASRIAPMAAPRLAAVYMNDTGEAVQALALRKADTAANVMLIDPFDSVVFDRTWKGDGVTFAALSQVAGDLLSGPGRGPEEAKELMQWMQANEQAWRVR